HHAEDAAPFGGQLADEELERLALAVEPGVADGVEARAVEWPVAAELDDAHPGRARALELVAQLHAARARERKAAQRDPEAGAELVDAEAARAEQRGLGRAHLHRDHAPPMRRRLGQEPIEQRAARRL